MLKLEWKKLLSNKLMLVVIVAIIAIPTMAIWTNCPWLW